MAESPLDWGAVAVEETPEAWGAVPVEEAAPRPTVPVPKAKSFRERQAEELALAGMQYVSPEGGFIANDEGNVELPGGETPTVLTPLVRVPRVTEAELAAATGGVLGRKTAAVLNAVTSPAAESMTSAAGLLTLYGTKMLEGGARIGAGMFAGPMWAELPEAERQAAEKIVNGSPQERMEGYIEAALSPAFTGLATAGVTALPTPKAVRLAEELKKEIRRTQLQTPEVPGGAQPMVEAAGERTESPLAEMERRAAAAQAENLTQDIQAQQARQAAAKADRPVIPETPAEPERMAYTSVIEEIRQRGLDTKEKIRGAWPQLSREEAGRLRRQAFPDEIRVGSEVKAAPEQPRVVESFEDLQRQVSQEREAPAEATNTGPTLQASAAGTVVGVPEAAGPPTTQTGVSGAAVREVPAAEIAARPDLMQFKRMDETASGVNAADKLAGDWDPLKGGVMLLWQPKNPSEYGLAAEQRYIVANGHHRLEFGKRAGVEGFNAQVIREADGYSAGDARALAAEINIADGKGTIYDQTKFIRNTAATHGEDEAVAAGRRIGAKGRKAASIALNAADPLYDSFINERVTADQAEAIALAAPKNDAAQRVGLKYALEGRPADFAANVVKAAVADKGPQLVEQDLFGSDDSAIRAMEVQASRAVAFQRGFREQIAAVQGAARRPELAAKLGVDVRDPAGVQNRIASLKAELARWEDWPNHPDLLALTRETGAGGHGGAFKLEVASDEQLAAEKAAQEAREAAARQKAELERRAAAPLTGNSAEVGQGKLFEADKDLFSGPSAEQAGPAPKNEESGGTMRPGPGARTAGTDFYEGSELQLLGELADQVAAQKPSIVDRVRVLADAADKVTDAKDGLKRSWLRFQSTVAARWSALTNLPWVGDYERTLGDLMLARQKASAAARAFIAQINRAVPDKLRREAMSNWIQAITDPRLDQAEPAVLRARAAASRGRLKRGYEMALQLTDAELTWARQAKAYFDSMFEWAQQAGLLRSFVEAYVPQFWKRENPITAALRADVGRGSLLNTSWKHAQKRVFDSYFAGEQAGHVPAGKDIGAIIAAYDKAFNDVIAARAAVKELVGGRVAHKGLDGKWTERPILAPVGKGRTLEAAEGKPSGAVLINPKVKPEDAWDYKVIDHASLRDWVWVGAGEEGRPIFLKGDLAVHPAVYRQLKNVLGRSAFQSEGVLPAIGRTVLRVQSGVKQTMFSLSPFHLVTEMEHALGHTVNPLRSFKIDLNDAQQAELVRAGLIAVPEFRGWEAFQDGYEGGGPLVGRIPVIGPTQKAFTRWLFHERIPQIKMMMGLDAMERNMKRYGETQYQKDLAVLRVRARDTGALPLDVEAAARAQARAQIAWLTARQANAAFGELNYTALGRNKTLQDVLRMFLVAPDFLEARGRFAGQAFRPYGREQLRALGILAAGNYLLARVLNELLDGDPRWELKHAFSVVHGGREYSLRTVPGDIAELFADPRRFASARLSPTVGRTLVEALSGRDYRGVKVENLGVLKNTLASAIPTPLRMKDDETWWEAGLRSTGLRSRPFTATMQVWKLAAEFNRQTFGVSPLETVGDSPYRPLKVALEMDNQAKARTEYLKLLQTRTARQIGDVFERLAEAPFTGSKAKEAVFQARLTPEEMRVYMQARNEQRAIWRTFQMVTGYRGR